MAAARRRVQLTLAAFWIVDALLQLQPPNFTPDLVYGTILGNIENQPGPIAGSIRAATHLLGPHVVSLNIAIILVQLAIGVGLLFGRTVKPALACSIVWALGIWWFGEGFGGLFAGEASLLVGAPGAAFLYALLALIAWPADRGEGNAVAGKHNTAVCERSTAADERSTAIDERNTTAADERSTAIGERNTTAADERSTAIGERNTTAADERSTAVSKGRTAAGAGLLGERAALRIWALLWAGGAILRVLPFWFAPVYALQTDLQTGLNEEPRWMLHLGDSLSSFAGSAGIVLPIAIALIEAAIGLGVLLSARRRRAFLVAGIVVSCVYWVVGQQMAGLLTGGATDIGAAPLYIVFALTLWPRATRSRQLTALAAPRARARRAQPA